MTGQIVGYARVSAKEQNLGLQIDALEKAGCVRVYSEEVSVLSQRDELDKALNNLEAGDALVVCKLDRLGRSMTELISIIEGLRIAEIGFKSLDDGIDTTSPIGRMLFGFFEILAEYEREIVSQRTKVGLEAAKRRGKTGGRPKKLSPVARKKAKMAKKLYESKEYSVTQICSMAKIGSKATLYRYLKHENTILRKG